MTGSQVMTSQNWFFWNWLFGMSIWKKFIIGFSNNRNTGFWKSHFSLPNSYLTLVPAVKNSSAPNERPCETSYSLSSLCNAGDSKFCTCSYSNSFHHMIWGSNQLMTSQFGTLAGQMPRGSLGTFFTATFLERCPWRPGSVQQLKVSAKRTQRVNQ